MKPSLLLILVFYLFLPFQIWALDYSPAGPFNGSNGTLTIASDANFTQPSLAFSPGQIVYLRVESTLITNFNRANNYTLYDYANNSLLNGTFTQTSTNSPYIFTASFVYPTNNSFTQLVITLTDAGRNTFNIRQTIETSGISQWYRIFQDSGYAQERYVYKNNDILYLKIYGNTQKSSNYSQKVYDFGGNALFSQTNPYTINGNWYTLAFTLNQTGLIDQKWYWLYAESRDTPSKRNFNVGRMFLLDNTLPTAQITSPASGTNLNGTVAITGTASDISLLNYVLAFEKSTTPGTWTTIGTSHTNQVTNATLENWNTTNLSAGTYTLRLTVTDKAGNIKQTTIGNLVKVIYTGAFSVAAPFLASLGPITVSPSQQTSTGKIGAGTGLNDIRVIDDRGTHQGWSLTMTMSDFFSGSQVLPVNRMTINPTDVTAINGSLSGISKGIRYTFNNDSDPATVMVAQSGSGTGTYWNDVELEYLVAPYPKAGSYSAAINFSIQ